MLTPLDSAVPDAVLLQAVALEVAGDMDDPHHISAQHASVLAPDPICFCKKDNTGAKCHLKCVSSDY